MALGGGDRGLDNGLFLTKFAHKVTVTVENLETGETEEHRTAGCLEFIGLHPNIAFLGAK